MQPFTDITRLLAVFVCSGIFWMMIWFLIEKVSLQHPLPGSTGLAIVVLVLAAYFLVGVVTKPDAVAFLVPPQL